MDHTGYVCMLIFRQKWSVLSLSFEYILSSSLSLFPSLSFFPFSPKWSHFSKNARSTHFLQRARTIFVVFFCVCVESAGPYFSLTKKNAFRSVLKVDVIGSAESERRPTRNGSQLGLLTNEEATATTTKTRARDIDNPLTRARKRNFFCFRRRTRGIKRAFGRKGPSFSEGLCFK